MSRVVFVSGTSRGIGLELARMFIARGDFVYGCGRHQTSIKDSRFVHFEVDLRSEDDILKIFRGIRQGSGYLDITINNAAIAAMNQFMLMPPSVNHDIFTINVLATVSLMRESAKLMLGSPSKSGRIVNLSSIAVRHAIEGNLAYSASKAAVENLTRTASKELSSIGVTVNCIRLPIVRTTLSRTIGRERSDLMRDLQTIKRDCTIDDIFNTVEFLTSERSSFVTGETVTLGGV